MKVKEKADEFAGRVKAIRKEVKLRQDEFCKKLDISSTQLSKIENGKNKPGHGFYYNIVREFNVNLDYLLFGEGPMFRSGETKKEDPSVVYQREAGYKTNEDIEEFMYYFFNSRYFRFQVMAEAVRIRGVYGSIINEEINRNKTSEKK
jgi:transcriptional regulator with XRE-family HTH domain